MQQVRRNDSGTSVLREHLTDHAQPQAGFNTGAQDPTRSSFQDTAQTTTVKTPWYKTRKFIIIQIVLAIFGIILLFLLLFPIVTAIAQATINKSSLNVDSAEITNPQNGSFGLHLKGFAAHTGAIPAKIWFTEPIKVSWVVDDSGTGLPLGSMNLSVLAATHHRAVVDQDTSLVIEDTEQFANFTRSMITQQNFTWLLESDNLRVQAAKFPMSHGIKFKKYLTLNGLNSFNGAVQLTDFQLPQDAPDGQGIEFAATTTLNNTSPFALNLGTAVFELSYKNVTLGQGSSTNTTIVPGNNSLTLKGILVPQNGQDNLDIVSELFTNFLNGDTSPVIAKGVSTTQADGTTIDWLSQGLQALTLTVPFVEASGAISPIKAIDIGSFAFAFNSSLPWNPLASSDSITARMTLPFGFNLNISQISNSFNIVNMQNEVVAGLATPLGASTSDVNVLSPTDTEGTINITISNTSLSCPDPQHPAFASFNQLLTSSNNVQFFLVGNSSAIANLSIGAIKLDPIKVNVSTSLKGLQGLNKTGMTTILGTDVTGGVANEGIQLDINVSIENPSNLDLETGDLSLQLFRNGTLLGTTLMPNLHLKMGNNSVTATSLFNANGSPEGIQTLNDFVGQKDVELQIAGYDNSTAIASLLQAFETLNIGVTLPGLNTSLLNSAELEILPTTGIASNISTVRVSLANPFSAALKVTRIKSSVSSFGINLGTINTDNSDTSRAVGATAFQPFTAGPKSNTMSPDLPLDMNFDPAALFTVTRALAIKAGESTDQLDAIVQLGGITYLTTNPPMPAPKRDLLMKRNLFTGFDLPSFVQKAFTQLESDVQLETDITIGTYSTTITYTQAGVQTKTDKSLDLILPVLAQPIVQKVVDASKLGINTVSIQDPEEQSFTTALDGSITDAGPFDAKITFNNGLDVMWNNAKLGSLKMDDVNVDGDSQSAAIKITSPFAVADVGRLTDFTKTLLTQESFDWVIQGGGLEVGAIGISVPNISLSSKQVTLKGMNGLKGGVTIKTFDLPSNDPAGGIHLTLEAVTTNPSQVGVDLSSIGFNNFASGIAIGPVVSTGPVSLAPLSSTTLSLAGRLIHQDSADGLAAVSTLFNNFVHGIDSPVTVVGASAGPSSVTWLNEGITALSVDTVLPNQGKINIIKSIGLNQLELLFTQDTAFNPSTGTNDTTAAFTLPFNFPVDIQAIEQNLTASFKGQSFATLDIPKGPAKTDVGPRIIHLTFNNVPFAVFDDQHQTFDDFVAATTIGDSVELGLSGTSNADAMTAVGLLGLTDIEFSVSTTIAGLQGLSAKPASVSNLDVNHGFSDFLLIKLDSSLFNPSNLTVGTGDVSFGLQFNGQDIGSALLDGLIILPGNHSYATDVHYQPSGGAATSAGQLLLENFLQGVDSDTSIIGSTSSSPIESLQEGLSQIKISPVTIPALHQNIITAVTLELPTDIVQTGIAQASFTLSNPFTASINLLKVSSNATFHDINLGSINADVSSNPIHADGHSKVTSPTLPFNFNLNPVDLIHFLTDAAADNKVDLGPLTDLFQFVLDNPDFKPPVQTSVDTSKSTCNSGKQFDVESAILAALKNLKVNLGIDSSTKLDDFATDLTFQQLGVPAVTDETALFLTGAIAGPITQHLVDQAELSFKTAMITGITNDGFDLHLVGSLTNTGPLDAEITFTKPVNVNWQGKDLGTISLPPVCAAANDGVPDYETDAHFTITDQDSFTQFATFLLHNENFTWTISTDSLRVNAINTNFDDVSLNKDITFKAFNNLPGVTISNFQLPSDDPAGGIHIETDAQIPSPSNIGIELGTVTFDAFDGDVLLGPLVSNNLTLAPLATAMTHLSGRIVPQSGDDLNVIGQLFSDFLAGKNSTLTTKGLSVVPPGQSSSVTWLTTAFKTLSLDVILPGQKFTIIQSITIGDLELTLTEQSQTFAPLTSSHSSSAVYQNPFGFSLQVIEAGQSIILGAAGIQTAQLNVPKQPVTAGVSTGNPANLALSWENIPLLPLSDDTQGIEAFEALFDIVTILGDIPFVELQGTVNVTAKTSIGNVPISGIPFDVLTDLQGLNDFNGNAGLSNVTITGSGGDGGNQFIVSPLTTTLENPSNISLNTVDTSLAVSFQGTKIGRAVVDTFNLVPGSNDFATEFHYQPDNANDTTAQAFLAEFLTTADDIPLTIHGDSDSTPFESLQEALGDVSLTGNLKGLNQPNLITQVNVKIPLSALVDNLVTVNFDLHNPLDATMKLLFVQNDAGVDGQIFSHFDQAFDNFVIGPGQTVNSGDIPNVLLTQGAIATLGIVGDPLDLASAVTVQIGDGGYTIPWLQLKQSAVPTTYDLDLAGLTLQIAGSKLSSGQMSQIKGMVSSMLGEGSSAVSSVASAASSIVSEAGQVISSGVAHVTSAAGQAVSSVVGDISKVIPDPSPAKTTVAASQTTAAASQATKAAESVENTSPKVSETASHDQSAPSPS